MRVQFSTVQSLDKLGHQGKVGSMRGNSAEFFQCFLQEALVGKSGMGRDVHFLVLSICISSADHGVTHPPRCA